MCIFIFLRLYNFIKGIVRMYKAFFRNLRPFFLYLIYELTQIFISFNRTNVPLFQQVNKQVLKRKGIVLLFYTHYMIKLEECQSHHSRIHS